MVTTRLGGRNTIKGGAADRPRPRTASCRVAANSLRHTGSDDGLGEAVSYLYTEWLPRSGAEPRDFPLYFQRLSLFPDVSENDAVTDIYLPLE